jgi:hypothetical protein
MQDLPLPGLSKGDPKIFFRMRRASELGQRSSRAIESESRLCPHLRFAIAQKQRVMSDFWSISPAGVPSWSSRNRACRRPV